MTRGSLVLGPALLGVLLVAACSPADEIGVTPTPEPAVTGSEVASGPTVGTGSEGVVDTCRDPSPVVTGLVGSVNTIVASANADAFEVTVVAEPPEACPGDLVRSTVDVVNTDRAAQTFSPNRGLLLRSGGMANWSLGTLGPVELLPGERWQTTVANTIPPVGPGTYALGPEGIPADGSVTVLDPVSAQGPSG